ncbi:MAG: hypothetical protein GQ565_03000 [Candidatus Aegiribacteria sp.]|nr:hypothetical protein [Candidatus Aegiribacteria sp.]
MRELRLSASSNSDFLSCQRRYQLSHIYGLKTDTDKESLRVGGRWHTCHEMLELKPGVFCPRCAKREEVDVACYICEGSGRVPEDRMGVVTRYLNKVYAVTPDNMTADEWELERVNLLYSLIGHQWYYKDTEDRFTIIGSELKLEIPIYRHQHSKRRMRKAVFVLKMDRLVREKATGLVYVWERKSTSRSLNDDYWQGLTQGDQVTGYVWGARIAQKLGLLAAYGVSPEDTLIAGAFCDVWHKPTIGPRMLTQKDTRVLMETGQYLGEVFSIGKGAEDSSTNINGIPAQVVQGKQGIAIRETAGMFGARLLQDISDRPEFYFQQRPCSYTDADLAAFGGKQPMLARQIRYVEGNNIWLADLHSCNSTFRCEFYDFCRSGAKYTPGDAAPCGYKLGWGSTPPVPEIDNKEISLE